MSGERPSVPWSRIVWVLGAVLFVSLGHYLTPPSVTVVHSLFQHLYLIPIVLASLWFGWRGGLLAAGCTAMCYFPHIRMWSRVNNEFAMSQYAELGSFFLLGGFTGWLADRERRRARQLEQTTAELSVVYKQLQESFEQVRRADRLSAVGQLAASLAHEIRNPLASIEGAVSVLDKPESTDELRGEFRRIIAKESRRLKTLLTDLLNFARPRDPAFRPVDMRGVAESVAGLAKHAAERADVVIRSELADSLPLLECDREQIEQVLMNLVLNAVQAMPEGGEVSISAAGEGDHLVLEVRDQGEGVPPETMERIFDPFETTKESGTGLGLAVCHQIVERHGGRISAARNPDRGMTFSVVLPLKQSRGATS